MQNPLISTVTSYQNGKIMITEEQFHNIRAHLDELF